MDGSEIRRQIVDHGYVLLPALLSPETIARLNTVVATFFERGGTLYNLGKTQPNAAMECPDLGVVFSDPAVIAAFQAALGRTDIEFTGHCDIHQDMFSSWHKDTGRHHGYFSEDCFVPECDVVKMAVYLQDHVDGGGLTVQPGTHRQRETIPAKGTSIASRIGDVVLFDVRISHRGRNPDGTEKALHAVSRAQRKAISIMTRTAKAPGDVGYAYAIKRLYDRIRGRPTRRSIFFTFGAPNRFTAQFAAANMTRQRSQYLDKNGASYPVDLVAALERQGVLVHQPN